MSRATLRQKRGQLAVVFAVVVFALGMTAAVAFGWENEQPKEHGKNEQEQGKEHGNKGEKNNEHKQKNEQEQVPTTPTTPVGPTTPAQAVPTTPPTPAQAPSPAPTPVGAQGAPERQTSEQKPSAAEKQVAQAPTTAAPSLAPVAEQKKLARTGLDPALIALLGVLALGGGVLLFRRAITR
jgi:uncharacterized protein HemX